MMLQFRQDRLDGSIATIAASSPARWTR